MKNAPFFQHDCNHCVFLGNFQGGDLYFHPNGMKSDLIHRESSHAHDYRSIPLDIAYKLYGTDDHHWITEIMNKAEKANLIIIKRGVEA